MQLHCPSCKKTIPSDNIDIANDKASCSNCGKSYAASQLANGLGKGKQQSENGKQEKAKTSLEDLWKGLGQAGEFFGIRYPSREEYEQFKANHIHPVLQNIGKKTGQNADHRLHPLYQKAFRRVIEIAVIAGAIYLALTQHQYYALYLIGFGVLFWFGINAYLTGANKRWKTIRNILVVAGIPLVFSGIFFYLLIYSGFAWSILEVGVPMGIKRKEDANFQEGYKANLVEPTLQFIDPNFSYTFHDGIAKEVVDNSLVFPFKAKYYSAEDYVQGNFNGLKLEFCDIMLTNTAHGANVVAFSQQKRNKENKDLHRQTAKDEMFRGLFFRLQLQQDFGCAMAMRPPSFNWTMEKRSVSPSKKDSLEEEMLQYATNSSDQNNNEYGDEQVFLIDYDPDKRLQDPDTGEQLKAVSIKDSEFSKQFKVFASEEGRIYNILTEATMDKIMALSYYWGEAVFMACRGSTLYLAMEMKAGVFDPSRTKNHTAAKEEYELDRFYTNFRRIIDLAASFQQVGQTV